MTYFRWIFRGGCGIVSSGWRKQKMPQKSPFTILLTKEEKKALEGDARKYTSPYYKVIRAKVVLLANEGLENKEIGERLELPRQIVSKWRKRFFEERLDGLEDLPRPGRTPRFSPSDRGGGKSLGV
jgi:hypothetical protein